MYAFSKIYEKSRTHSYARPSAQVVPQVGLPAMLDFFRHFSALGLYTLLASTLGKPLQTAAPLLPRRVAFWVRRTVEVEGLLTIEIVSLTNEILSLTRNGSLAPASTTTITSNERERIWPPCNLEFKERKLFRGNISLQLDCLVYVYIWEGAALLSSPV